MRSRQALFEELIGDLEFNPKRAVAYLLTGAASVCVWLLAEWNTKTTAVPLVFGFGGTALVIKGIFLLRRTSDGLAATSALGLPQYDDLAPRFHQRTRSLARLRVFAARILQDFGAGGLLLAPVLHIVNNVDRSRSELPASSVFIGATIAFLIGLLIRRLSLPGA